MNALSIPCTSHEQALAVIQHGWAVVDGDRCTGIITTRDVSHEWCGQGLMPCNGSTRPPAEWLKALTCETCDGEGVEFAGDDDDIGDGCEARDGRGKPRIEVTAPCPKCDGTGTRRKAKAENCLSLRWVTMECTDCTNGRLHVGWVTVTEVLGPVVHDDFEDESNVCPNEPHVFAYADIIGGEQVWRVMYCDGVDTEGWPESTDITADVAHLGNPGDLAGRWLLKLEVAA